MIEVNLEFIAHQLERVLAEQRGMQNQLASIHDQLTILPSMRDELRLIKEETKK